MSGPTPSAVTVGNFDGVHRGHRLLVDRTVDLARARGLRPVALTFDPHPAAVLRPDAAPAALQSLEERIAALGALGIAHVEVLPFDASVAALSPEAFVAQVLVARLGARLVVVGANFRFGHRASGDLARLTDLGRDLGFDVEAVDLVGAAGGPVSSTAIRGLVAAGDVEVAAELLGRPFALTGPVVRGDGRGRGLGVPTANVALGPGRVLPADGVYAGRASAPADPATGRPPLGPVPCVTNVGWRPTFEGRTRTVEAHLLDVDPDLYGRDLTVTFEARIRGEERFAGPEALVARIRQDVARARELLGTGAGGPRPDGPAGPDGPADPV